MRLFNKRQRQAGYFKTPLTILAGARNSFLSQIQFKEIQSELLFYHPYVQLDSHFVSTIGDRDQQASLRQMEKTDFFTKEIDQLVLEGVCQVGIHSAKDLPCPLPSRLKIIALTKSIEPVDVVVLREGQTLSTLPVGAVIATSSERREQAFAKLRSDVSFMDLRGTIEQRIAKVERGEADGVIVAEAALLRLGLTHLNRVRLPGETTPLQGSLAVVALEENFDMWKLFRCLDRR